MEALVKKAGFVFLMSCGILLLSQQSMAQSQKDKNDLKMEKSKENAEGLQLKITGMSCQAGCANGIDKMLSGKSGVLESNTSFDSGSAEIRYDKSIISEKEIIALIEEKGFKAEGIKEN